MKNFDSLGALAVEIGSRIAAEAAAEHRALERATVLVQRTAIGRLGEYQGPAGPFAGWAPLAASTVTEKERLGFAAPDNPELRTGRMGGTIERQVEWPEGHVGSNDQVLEWQELGTSRMPPRSIIGGAAAEKAEEIAAIVGEEVFLSLVGDEVVGGRLSISE